MSNLIKKITYIRIVVEENKNTNDFQWKLFKCNNLNEEKTIITSGSELTLEEAFKESLFAFYNTN